MDPDVVIQLKEDGMLTMKRVRLLAAGITIAGGLALRPAPANAAALTECTGIDWDAAIQDANDQCAAGGYSCFHMLSCEYDDCDPDYWNSTFQCTMC